MKAPAKKRALILVDVQNDFCPGGALAVSDGDQVVAPLNELIEEFLTRGDLVVKSRDWHPPQTKHFAAHGGIWPVHCVQNTRGAQFHPQLCDDPRIVVVSKGLGDEDGYSAFDNTGLASILRAHNVEEIWVGGLATDYCVKHTVLDALREELSGQTPHRRRARRQPQPQRRPPRHRRNAPQRSELNDERGTMNDEVKKRKFITSSLLNFIVHRSALCSHRVYLKY
ncbi:MAG: isochorismatase family protein [Pyrinomonadaceae bacterium]